MIKTKRIYNKPETSDGFRILVDKIWPRGIRKSKADIDWWFKEIAPSSSLRKWFSHDPAKWKDFKKRYRQELKPQPELLAQIKQLEKKERKVTLLYAAKDEEHNNAVALKEFLEK